MFDNKQHIKYKPFGGLNLSHTGFVGKRDSMFGESPGTGMTNSQAIYRN
jgi:hypothetical protein